MRQSHNNFSSKPYEIVKATTQNETKSRCMFVQKAYEIIKATTQNYTKTTSLFVPKAYEIMKVIIHCKLKFRVK